MQFTGVSAEKAAFLAKLWQKLNTPAEGYTFAFTEGAEFTVEKQGNRINIICNGDTQQYRSLLLAAQLIAAQKEGKITQSMQFEHTGAMLDMSRAGVMQVNAVKEYMEYMALCGLNRLMLYIEDIYTLEGYDYFGYMRGRYSCEDLKEIDAYGRQCGVEVIPCMQTLGHMEQYLRLNEGKKMAEDATVLLVDCEDTYALIEKMISTLSGCFTSRKIHIGMDEAHGLGRGAHLTKYGYESPFELYVRHLARVKEITDRYGLEPMIWGDMCFRFFSSNHNYDAPEVEFPANIKELFPKGLTLVYYDYSHLDQEHHWAMIEKSYQLCDNIVFAGGIHLWRGLLPDHQMTFDATNAALPACKTKGIKDVYATIWGDDGAETDPWFGLPGLLLYGQHAWEAEPDQSDTDARMRLLCGADTKDFLDLAVATCPLARFVYGGPPRMNIKQIVYSDILFGLFEVEMQDARLVPIYNELEQKFAVLAQKPGVLQTNFAYTAALCRLAAHKIEIAQQLPVGYKAQDKALLRRIKDQLLPTLAEDYANVKRLHSQMWHKTNRPFGFEVVDSRYGGKIARIQTACERLEDYLTGKIDTLPELEEKRLPCLGKGPAPAYNLIYSTYLWR